MAAGTDVSFKIRNALVVNTAFSVNSTGIYFSNVFTSNGSFFAGQSAFVNTSGNFNVSGNLTINAAFIADNSSGDLGQVLTSANTYTYWSTLAASAFTDTTNASLISTGTLAIARLPANVVSNAQLTNNLANYPTSTQLTNNLANYPTSTQLTNNLANYPTTTQLTNNLANYPTSTQLTNNLANYPTSTNLTNNLANYQTSAGLASNVATLGYQTTAGLSANVATLTANNSTNFNGQAASYYTNGTNISTGTVAAARLPANLLTANTADQTVTGGVVVTSLSLSAGNITVDCGSRPLQYIASNSNFTITAPTSDGSCVLLLTNGTAANTVTFSGFTVGTNTGDALTKTSGNRFMVYIVRINAISTYTIKALQ